MFTERRSGHHDDLKARRSAAAQRWASATGGAAPCAVDRAGGQRDPAKYHEGEVAALTEAMRIVASSGPVDALPLVEEALADWTHRANSLSASPTSAWRAYHEGGRDALEAFLDAEQRDAHAR
jgi:hypothetical protein